MSEKDIEKQHHTTLEELRQNDESGIEFWNARDLQPVFEYGSWNKFKPVIEKAMLACKQSGHLVDDHFARMGKMVKIGSGASRKVEDYQLSRYACYLIVQNGDPAKSVIANGQTYFAVQARRQELSDDQTFQQLK